MRLVAKYLAYFIAPTLGVAAQHHPVPAAAVATRVLLPGAECALFPSEAARANPPEFEQLRELPLGYFTPIWPQVAEAELLLSSALLQPLTTAQPARYYRRRQVIIRARLPAYRRQYVGFYNARRQPGLFINFFYSAYFGASDPGWLQYGVGVDDGGDAFWHVCYNLATHRFYHFSPNPEG